MPGNRIMPRKDDADRVGFQNAAPAADQRRSSLSPVRHDRRHVATEVERAEVCVDHVCPGLEGESGLSEEPVEQVRAVLHPSEPVLHQRDESSMPVTALLAMLRLRWAHTDSTALSSEA
jgi:hypothetical protein